VAGVATPVPVKTGCRINPAFLFFSSHPPRSPFFSPFFVDKDCPRLLFFLGAFEFRKKCSIKPSFLLLFFSTPFLTTLIPALIGEQSSPCSPNPITPSEGSISMIRSVFSPFLFTSVVFLFLPPRVVRKGSWKMGTSKGVLFLCELCSRRREGKGWFPSFPHSFLQNHFFSLPRNSKAPQQNLTLSRN